MAAQKPLPQVRACGVLVMADAPKRFLLMRHKDRWDLPKGHIDPGEIPAATALRETTEESGFSDLVIVADLGSELVEFDHQGQHYRRTEYYFLMALQGETQVERPAEDQLQFQVVWLPLAEAVTALTFAAEKTVARKALQAYARL